MKRILFTTLFAAIAITLAAQPGAAVHEGTVSCRGEAVAGVVVTDGWHCAVTDKRGRFSLPSEGNARFIYLSTPAGYASLVEDNVVRFYLPVEDNCRSYDFELMRKPADDTRHGFVAVADPQIYARKEFGMLEKAAEDIRNTVQGYDVPFHGICAGDIIMSDHRFYPEYNRVMAAAGLEFRCAMGNHDMTLGGRSHETSYRAYEAVYGPCYYSYNVGKVHYVVLNNCFYIGRDWFYIGYLDETQLAWLGEDLKYVPAGSTVVVTLHIPTAKEKEKSRFEYDAAASYMCNYGGLYSLLEPYNAHIVSGHIHTTTNIAVRPGLYEHNVASLGAAWWQGELCTDGTPAGYAVFEVDGDAIEWYYKSTGYPRDFQMKIYDGTEAPEFAGRIVANVWNCDDDWSVAMSVDGGEPVAMERMTAVDPQARAMYADPSKLEHKWISASPSDHYYTAPLPTGAKHVEVIATDRFSNTYRAEKHLI